jgi:hypothetical protein
MSRFRKRPVEVEARQLGRGFEEDLAIMEWCGGMVPPIGFEGEYLFRIPTLEGDMRATSGDYIIRGVEGEFYPCKPAIFLATYEEVPE